MGPCRLSPLVQVHVQKRFEDLWGPARQHLVSRMLRVEVTRDLAGPDAVLDSLISTTTDGPEGGGEGGAPAPAPALGPAPALAPAPGPPTAGAPGAVSLAAPPPPRVRRPASSRMVEAPPLPGASAGAAAAGGGSGAPAGARPPLAPEVVPRPLPAPPASAAPLEEVVVSGGLTEGTVVRRVGLAVAAGAKKRGGSLAVL
jgi:hypothetical protein